MMAAARAIDFATGAGPYWVALDDLDGDGLPDVAVTNFGLWSEGDGTTVSVLRNTSTNGVVSFEPKRDFTSGVGPRGIAVGDLDGDGRPDLLVANYGPGGIGTTISVLRSLGAPGTVAFAPKVDFTVAGGPMGVAIGDLDGDGKADAVVANYGNGAGSTLSTLRNTSTNGALSFAPRLDLTVGTGPHGVAIADLNGDGWADLVGANYGTLQGSGTDVSVLQPFGFADRQIVANVPDGATTGPVHVVTPGGTATSSTAFTVVAAPVAQNRNISTPEDTAVSDNLIATDADGDALTFSIVANGLKGVASITDSATGAFVYTPNANATGGDSFTFKANDGRFDSNVATVSVNITKVNDPPVAFDASYTTSEGTSVNGTLGATDVDDNALKFFIVSNGTKGSATITNSNSGAFTYTPNPGASGTDTFTFIANDGQSDSNVATITIVIVAVSHPPTASNGTLTTSEDAAATGTLVASDADGDALTFAIVAFIYTPNSNANGTDTFTFKANDGQLDSSPATITVTITPVNDPPVASNGSIATNEDVATSGTLAATDVDGTPLTFSIVVNGTKGTAVVTNAATGAFTYTPNPNENGADSFTFRVSDGQTTSDVATVQVTIAPVNDAPVAAAASYNVTLPNPLTATLGATDVEGSPLTFELVAAPKKGTVVINAATGQFTYTPARGAKGGDSFTFRASDGSLWSNTAKIGLTLK
jgi:hypothetical protein